MCPHIGSSYAKRLRRLVSPYFFHARRLRPSCASHRLRPTAQVCLHFFPASQEWQSSSATAMALADLRQAAMAVRRALSQCTDMRPDSSAWCSTDTPYGRVCVESDVHCSSHQLTVYAFADVRFISLCMHCQRSGRHMDKAIPGNDKRPDGGRGIQFVY